MTVLDFLLPKIVKKKGGLKIQPTLHEDMDIYSFFSYKDPIIKSLVWDFKYKLKPSALFTLTDIMSDELIAHMSDTLSDMHPSLITYSPSSSFASGKRKWDQMKELSSRLQPFDSFFHVCIDAVIISKEHNAQHLGSKRDRVIWSKDRYVLSPQFSRYIKDMDSHIYCIDDIVTTGSTFNAIKKLLYAEGVKEVSCFAICSAK